MNSSRVPDLLRSIGKLHAGELAGGMQNLAHGQAGLKFGARAYGGQIRSPAEFTTVYRTAVLFELQFGIDVAAGAQLLNKIGICPEARIGQRLQGAVRLHERKQHACGCPACFAGGLALFDDHDVDSSLGQPPRD